MFGLSVKSGSDAVRYCLGDNGAEVIVSGMNSVEHVDQLAGAICGGGAEGAGERHAEELRHQELRRPAGPLPRGRPAPRDIRDYPGSG